MALRPEACPGTRLFSLLLITAIACFVPPGIPSADAMAVQEGGDQHSATDAPCCAEPGCICPPGTIEVDAGGVSRGVIAAAAGSILGGCLLLSVGLYFCLRALGAAAGDEEAVLSNGPPSSRSAETPRGVQGCEAQTRRPRWGMPQQHRHRWLPDRPHPLQALQSGRPSSWAAIPSPAGRGLGCGADQGSSGGGGAEEAGQGVAGAGHGVDVAAVPTASPEVPAEGCVENPADNMG